ncbi:hypothetical protein NM688_g4648 [Phlebia brevispora]|uniref:Uncharacterized protein n=1 Tax=Phlebia brevispora TaxID=194682 RepID=A0ACC1T2E0_9APHY|nr:hypothetical protein NM688_g4648 [Phlebia brevispora]
MHVVHRRIRIRGQSVISPQPIPGPYIAAPPTYSIASYARLEVMASRETPAGGLHSGRDTLDPVRSCVLHMKACVVTLPAVVEHDYFSFCRPILHDLTLLTGAWLPVYILIDDRTSPMDFSPDFHFGSSLTKMADVFPPGTKVSFMSEGGQAKTGVVKAIRIVDGNHTYAEVRVDGENPNAIRNISTLALTRMRTRDISRLLGALLDIWSTPGGTIIERCATLAIRFWLIILATFLAFSEGLLTRTFEWASGILSIPPCGVYTARESAVVIIGGEDGLGRAVALSFSELGYTVFVLYPATLEDASTQSVKSLNVSSVRIFWLSLPRIPDLGTVKLLYIWHKKKEQSTHGSWGLVAPISLDTESGAQRAHASDTIHAYCVDHALNLVSLIILPPSSSMSEGASSHKHMDEEITAASNESLAFATRGNVAHAIIEPILVVEDYVDLLKKTSGRVIMLSVCTHDGCLAPQTPHRLLDGVSQRVAQNLSYVLDPLGVRVCSVTIGSFEPSSDDGFRRAPEEHLTRALLVLSASCGSKDEWVQSKVRIPIHQCVIQAASRFFCLTIKVRSAAGRLPPDIDLSVPGPSPDALTEVASCYHRSPSQRCFITDSYTCSRAILLTTSPTIQAIESVRMANTQIASHSSRPFPLPEVYFLARKAPWRSVLWTTYSEASAILEPHVRSPIALAAMSGAVAGATQAVIAAPAENVRFVLEGASSATGWSHAKDQIHEAREVRDWMREVGDMAGRGWNGWLWGAAKDFCGFAVFFSVFELTRRAAARAKSTSSALVQEGKFGSDAKDRLHRHTPRIVHAITLVTGGAIAGLAYEVCCRPWDAARKAVHVDRVVSAEHHSVPSICCARRGTRVGYSSSEIPYSMCTTLPPHRSIGRSSR